MRGIKVDRWQLADDVTPAVVAIPTHGAVCGSVAGVPPIASGAGLCRAG